MYCVGGFVFIIRFSDRLLMFCISELIIFLVWVVFVVLISSRCCLGVI